MLKQIKLILIYKNKYNGSNNEYRVNLYHDGVLVSSEEYINNAELDELLERYLEEGYEECYTHEEVSQARQIYMTRSKYVVGGPKEWILKDDGKAHCPYCDTAGMFYGWQFCPNCGAYVNGGRSND